MLNFRSAIFVALATSAIYSGANAQSGEAQALVDRSTLAVQAISTGETDDHRDLIRSTLRRARAVMICPRVFKAGFLLGGMGGECALVARDGGGSWSSPAFYSMAGGSFGFQAGIQDAEVLMTIMNDKALNAIINSQFRLGAEAGLSIANLGAGIAGGTTSAVGADVVVFSKTRGLFAGVSIEGALMSFQHERNVAYYGKDVSSRQIVVGMEAHNQGSDVLRSTLMNLATAGERTTGVTARPNMPQYIGQSAEPARTQGMAIPSGRVSSESLPPISGRR